MKSVYALATALALVVLGSGTAYSQCTSETEQGRRVVTEFATQFGAGTRPAGVPVVDASQIRLLTNATDAAVCQQLFYKYMGQRQDPEGAPTDRHWTYYQVGNLYYMVVTRVSPPVQQTSEGIRLRLGWTPILIFAGNLDHIATVGR
jgi:hypothetical protein